MNLQRPFATMLAFLVAVMPTSTAWADPCGMVPPIYLGDGLPIARIGVQKTFVFYKDGMESIVIRPGFSGKVDEFGMLIPFPSPPAIRKVADDVFAHVAAAVDPPQVVVDLRMRFRGCGDMAMPSAARESNLAYTNGRLEKQEVAVLREEAVGMYEVAVLEAGSAAALARWMEDHGFRYPQGMDAVCEEYVEDGWCFVAVKARVGQKAGSDPRPGMRSTETSLPPGASFDGHVQAMGFRFFTDEFVVPMRLSAFNEGDLRNVVYVLSDGPRRIANISADLVVRQVPGHVLYRHLTEPLPLQVIGGNVADIPEWRLQSLPTERDPKPHNGIARELFAADLLALRHGRLTHPHEEMEKELLEIGERLGLRGRELDVLHVEALQEQRERMVDEALADLAGMTLTVIDGDFPRDVIAAENLELVAYQMPQRVNRPDRYDAKFFGPAPAIGGFLGSGPPVGPHFADVFLAAGALIALVFITRHRRRFSGRRVASATFAAMLMIGLFGLTRPGMAGAANRTERREPRQAAGIDASAVKMLLAQESDTIERLLAEARDGASFTSRGWAIIALSELGGDDAEGGLHELYGSTSSNLVRTWASAALVRLADGPRELARLTDRANYHPALARPVTARWLELLADPDEPVALEVVLDALARSYPLQQKVLPVLLTGDSEPFVEAMLGAGTQEARNLAAGCLATFASQGREGIAVAVLSALRFDADATRVPWQGGPLFLPSLGWTSGEARILMRHLVAWHLYCDRHDLDQEQRQIHNNLNGWGLANAAGYTMPNRELSTSRWLLIFGEVAGSDKLAALLEEQGVHDERLYQSILVLVSER